MSDDNDDADTLTCKWPPCSREFIPRKRWQEYCSNKCRMSYANERRKQAMALLGDWPIVLPPAASSVQSSTGY